MVRHARYRVVSRVGSGRMGVVYKAEHRLMKRVVALKVISPRLTATGTAVARFRREVEAVAKQSHANIVAAKVYSTGHKYAESFKKTMKILFDKHLPKWNYRAIPES